MMSRIRRGEISSEILQLLITNEESVPRALLPRGFGVAWGSSWNLGKINFLDDYDHHLMQFALKNNLHSVYENGNGPGGGFTTRLQTVFKDTIPAGTISPVLSSRQ